MSNDIDDKVHAILQLAIAECQKDAKLKSDAEAAKNTMIVQLADTLMRPFIGLSMRLLEVEEEKIRAEHVSKSLAKKIASIDQKENVGDP
jgi:hypothetical protein